jgi:4-amino-4-deoxy-L-arabinose transferase-like glycosyltransferase/membrane-associated phospholipid phosphatase
MNKDVTDTKKIGSKRSWSPSRWIVCLCGLAVLFGLLALLAWRFDQTVSTSLHLSESDQGSFLFWHAAQPVKLFGKGDILFLLGLVLAIYRRKQVAAAACIAALIAGLIVVPTKSLVGRERPNGRDTRSFPSGDAAAVAAFAVPVAAAFPAAIPVVVLGTAAIGTARVATGFHFPSDILAGMAIGVLAGALVLYLRITLNARLRRFLRRSFIAAGLGLFVLIHLLFSSDGNVRQFLLIFGPALGLVALAPFLRALLCRRRHANNLSRTGYTQALALGLATVLFFCYLFVTTRSTLWDRDETRFSEATVEMVHSGDYLVPTLNGELRPDKPILIYWLMSLPVRLLGPTELACRFFSAVGAAVTCLLTALLARHLVGPGPGPSAGLSAMLILATTPLFLLEGTAATTDAVLLATIVGAFAVFENAFRTGLRKIHLGGLAVTLGAALLAKGPVGLALPMLAMVVILVLARRFSFAWAGTLFGAALLASGIFLAWAIPANNATGGEFLRRGIGYHVIERATRPIDGHGGNFFLTLPFYIPVVIMAFFPWSLFLPGALSATAGGRIGGMDGRSFLLGWMIPIVLFMSFVSTKLPHYILPIWPALSLSVAGTISLAERGGLSAKDLKWFVRGRRLFVGIGILCGTALLVGPWFVPALGLNLPGNEPLSPGLAWPIAGIGATFLVMTVLASREHAAGRYRAVVGILVAGMVCAMFTVSVIGLPMAESFKVSKPLADAIRARTTPDVEVVSLDYDLPSFIFYLGRKHLTSVEGDTGVLHWAKQPEPGVLVLTRQALARIESGNAPLGLKEIVAVRGRNYSKGRWTEVVALGRNLP